MEIKTGKGPQVLPLNLPAKEGEDKGEQVGLCFTTNAIIELEKKFDCAVHELGLKLKEQRVEGIRRLALVALEGWRVRCKPSREQFTEEEAGNAYDELGGLCMVGDHPLIKLFMSSVQSEDVEDDVDSAVAKLKAEGEAAPENPTQ